MVKNLYISFSQTIHQPCPQIFSFACLSLTAIWSYSYIIREKCPLRPLFVPFNVFFNSSASLPPAVPCRENARFMTSYSPFRTPIRAFPSHRKAFSAVHKTVFKVVWRTIRWCTTYYLFMRNERAFADGIIHVCFHTILSDLTLSSLSLSFHHIARGNFNRSGVPYIHDCQAIH